MAGLCDFNVVMDLATAETIGAKQPPVPSPLIVSNMAKQQSRKILKQIHSTRDAVETYDLVVKLVQTYNGVGMYPLGAIERLARFPEMQSMAVVCLLEIIRTATSRFSSGSRILCASSKKSKSMAIRYYKNFDTTLARIICTRWIWSVKTGGEWDWNPMQIDAKVYAFCIDMLATTCMFSLSPLQTTDPHNLIARDRRKYFPVSRKLVRSCQSHRLAILKAHRIAGHRLPPELVDIIIDYLFSILEVGTLALCTVTAAHVKSEGKHLGNRRPRHVAWLIDESLGKNR